MSAEVLYIGSNGYVAAIRVGDGQELWRTKLGQGFLPATGYQDVCVIEHNGTVLAGCQGHVFGLDASTGDLKWHNDLKGMGHNDVTLAIAGKSIQYVATQGRQ
jgi:outer membrane protein assembly factor BamB